MATKRHALRPLIRIKMPVLKTETGGVRACLEVDKSPGGMWVVNVSKISGERGARKITRVAREEMETQADVAQCLAEVLIRLEREDRKNGH